MKTISYLIIGLLFVFACSNGQENKDQLAITGADESSDFEIELSKAFYMTGDDMSDLYISSKVVSGAVRANTEIELLKKSNPSEKISGKIYRLDTPDFKTIDEAGAGKEVILYIRFQNDKKFALGYNGDEYILVKKGAKAPKAEPKAMANVEIKIDGVPWTPTYVKTYHYTKPFGVTKAPANILFYCTKPNDKMKNSKEEVVQVVFYTGNQDAHGLTKENLEFTFMGMVNGKEVAYENNKNYEASAEITSYVQKNGQWFFSGKGRSLAKEFLCKDCPLRSIEVQFTDIPIEIYDR